MSSILIQEKKHYNAKKKDSLEEKMKEFDRLCDWADNFLYVYSDFDLKNFARDIKTDKEREIEFRDEEEKKECESRGLEYLKRPRVLIRTIGDEIDFNAHWDYLKNLYWKNQESNKDSILFFMKIFFQKNTIPEKLTKENKREIMLVRGRLGWTIFGFLI